MLLEAQQERDHLKAAVTQETVLNGPPEQNREAPGLTTEVSLDEGMKKKEVKQKHSKRFSVYFLFLFY